MQYKSRVGFLFSFFEKGQAVDSSVISGGLSLQQLGAGLGFLARHWAGLWPWEHQLLATRPAVSNKGPSPSALQKRVPTKMESSESSKVLRGKRKCIVHVDKHMGRLRGKVPEWRFKLPLWGVSSGFHSANHFYFPGSQSMFGLSQDPLLCVRASLSQGESYRRGVWVEHPLTLLPLWPARSHFCARVVGEVS